MIETVHRSNFSISGHMSAFYLYPTIDKASDAVIFLVSSYTFVKLTTCSLVYVPTTQECKTQYLAVWTQRSSSRSFERSAYLCNCCGRHCTCFNVDEDLSAVAYWQAAGGAHAYFYLSPTGWSVIRVVFHGPGFANKAIIVRQLVLRVCLDSSPKLPLTHSANSLSLGDFS